MRSHAWLNASKLSFSRSAARRARRVAKRRTGTRKLQAECLEDRRLLAFDVLTEITTGFNTQYVELAQINADSQVDMVTIENGRVTIRLGSGGGSFGDPLASTTDILAERAITGDFTDDGVTDLLTSASSQLSLRIGNGDGTFQPPQPVNLPSQWESAITGVGLYAQYVSSMAAGDLNEDGSLDLILGGLTSFPYSIGCGYYSCGYIFSYSGYVNVLLGTGEGTFDYADADPGDVGLNAHPLGIYQTADSLAVEDINHDGHPDVLTAKLYGGLAALLGNGTGQLQSPVHSGSGVGFKSFPLADLNGDGNLDTISRLGNSLVVQKGQGDGSFVQDAVMDSGLNLKSAVVGDVDGDGTLDLVAVGPSMCTSYGYYGGCYDATHTRQTSVLLGNGQGGFSLPIISSLGTDNISYPSLIDVALLDLTGDGLLDLTTVDLQSEGRAIIAANDGTWAIPGELAIADVSVVEGNSGSLNAVFTVTLTGGSGTVTVDYVTVDYQESGTLEWATASQDYTPQSGTLSFGPGVASLTITVPILGDRIGEGKELFFVNLSNPTGALLRDEQAVGTILDNEPTISIDHAFGINPLTVVEGDTGTTPAVFTVTLSQPYNQTVTVDYYTGTGHTSDIVSTSGKLTFLAGETSKTITVQVVGDRLDEPLEAFNVYLASASSNAFLGNSSGYCYIEDNDPTNMVSISDVSKNEGNSGTTKFNFTLNLSAPADAGTFVEFFTEKGTATTANQDFVSKSGFVYFKTGATTATISIDVKGDRNREANETFFVNLIGVNGAAIADSQGVGTILNDDGGSTVKPPKIRLSDASVSEGNSATKLLKFTVSLSQASTKEVRVTYATANGTAKTGNSDYVAKSATLRFAPGETSKSITVTVKGDTSRESDEYFLVKLSDAVNGTIADGQGVGTILNDDGRGNTSRLSSHSDKEREGALADLSDREQRKRHR